MKRSEIKQQHYDKALQLIADYFDKADEKITPISIIQNGNIGTIGVSDLDLIFVFPENFNQGNEFSRAYSEAISAIPFKEIFFIHLPMLLSETVIEHLPQFTFNPTSELNVIFGKEVSYAMKKPDKIQSLLISLEFIQFRLFQLMNMYRHKNINQHGLLLRGHSMKHSISLAKNAGIDVSPYKFSAFNIVEEIRLSVKKGKVIQLNKDEVNNLAKGIINEFKLLYQLFARETEKYVSIYLPDQNRYEYEENVFLTDLFNSDAKMQHEIENGRLIVKGMHWINMLLRDIYFESPDSTSIIVDRHFEEQCVNRAEFHKKQWNWNKKVFGSINAGLSPMPALIGKKAETYASKYWGI